ncbi:hypothetical protein OTU49_005442 [Cherax quadricarinatus]|uniref:Chitin-binding type-2 domain-containing protein n=1 Tax=Cherax quadricarinatus TaxID=27406 RepID=A0AAW0X5G1_CHEQU
MMSVSLVVTVTVMVMCLPHTQGQSLPQETQVYEDCPYEVARGCRMYFALFQRIAIPTDCTKYCQCTAENTGLVTSCLPNLYFNDVLNACIVSLLMNCGTRPIPPRSLPAS